MITLFLLILELKLTFMVKFRLKELEINETKR